MHNNATEQANQPPFASLLDSTNSLRLLLPFPGGGAASDLFGLRVGVVVGPLGDRSVYRTILFSLSSLPELKSNDSSWEDSTSELAVVWSSPSVWRLVKILLALVLLSTGESRAGTVRLRSRLDIQGCRLASYFFVVGCQNL